MWSSTKLIEFKGLKIILCVLATYSHFSLSSPIDSEPLSGGQTTLSKQQHLEQQALKKIAAFATELKQQLVTAIAQGGLVNGVKVCSQQAQQIALSHSTDGWQISRTSLRVRNPDNRPLPWQVEILNQFERRKSQGEPVNQLQQSKLYKQGRFELVKAIETAQICTACHGKTIEPELQKTINTLYPQDQAIGFETGDIRGAFSVIKNR